MAGSLRLWLAVIRWRSERKRRAAKKRKKAQKGINGGGAGRPTLYLGSGSGNRIAEDGCGSSYPNSVWRRSRALHSSLSPASYLRLFVLLRFFAALHPIRRR